MATAEQTRQIGSLAIKIIQFVALLITAGFLFRSGMAASMSTFFRLHPNSVAIIWSDIDTIAALLIIPTSFAILAQWRPAILAAIGLATVAFSGYLAISLLLQVDRLSDQTYVQLNPYLKDINPILAMSISLTALISSFARLKSDPHSRSLQWPR